MKSKNLSGTFIGLDPNSTLTDMLTAVYEGVAFGHRLQVEQLKKSGLNYDTAVISGGAANSDVWMQMFADILGFAVTTVDERETGALGDAITAAVMCGAYPDYKTAVNNMVRFGKTYFPADEKKAYYNEKFAVFTDLVNRLSKE